MSGRERNDEKEGREGGGGGGRSSTFWKVASAAAAITVVAGYLGGWETFWKVAGAAVVVAGGIYSIIVEQMEANRVPVEAGGSGVAQPKVWTKPKVGWLKLNVDGSRRPKIELAGCGGVLRDGSGKWVKGFAQKLSPSSSLDETEKNGILKGLQWAKDKGFMRVEVESDSEGIVEKVNSWSRSADPLILAIRELLRSPETPDWQTTLTWIPRDANEVADKLADIGRNLTSDDLKEYDYPPASCLTALNNDLRLL